MPTLRAASVLQLALVALLSPAFQGCDNARPVASDNDEVSSPFAGVTVARESSTPTTLTRSVSNSLSFTEVKFPHEFTYQNGEEGKSLMVETVGGGCGWLDFDRDGNWDLYVCQGGDPKRQADSSQPIDALIRNSGNGVFTQATAQSAIKEYGYGQGVAISDFDGDGFDDIYVTNVKHNTLWKNLGDGTFEEVSEHAGVDDKRWSSSAAWADIDSDGDLDLYVCNYVAYDPLNPLDCRTKTGETRICHPQDLDPLADECFINQGDGTFTPEAEERGLFGNGNKALGVAIADFSNDGLPDIYVANDTTGNFMFLNQGDGQFVEQGELLGCHANRVGAYQASMGLGVFDFDRNGLLDIYSTHFYGESNTMYKNLGEFGFQDVTARVGLHAPTMNDLAWGILTEDFDCDGREEIFIATGHVENYPGNPLHKMHPRLLAFDGKKWSAYDGDAGEYFKDKYVGRGAASADIDHDGDPDVCVVHQNSRTMVLRNESKRGNWLTIEFRGTGGNRRGIGTRVTATIGGEKRVQELAGGTSYASSNQPILFFGLGQHTTATKLDVTWPSRRKTTLTNVAANQRLVIDEPSK